MLQHVVQGDNTEVFGRRAGQSHQLSTMLVLLSSQMDQQVISMLQQNDVKRVLDLLDLEPHKPNFLASVGLRVKKANANLLFCNSVVHGNLDDVLGTAVDVVHDKEVRQRRTSD